MIRFIVRRLLSGLAVLLDLLPLFLAQDLALRTRTKAALPHLGRGRRLPGVDTVRLWQSVARGDLGAYAQSSGAYGDLSPHDVTLLLAQFLARSVALLLLAMILGGLAGGAIGLLAAGVKRRGLSSGVLLLSIIGISTPSFFLGLLLQYAEILLYRASGVRLLPVGGFGWDAHLVLPVLVLAARPVAQVARLTCVRAQEVLAADYVRTARAKGLYLPWIWQRHVITNVAGTVLTAMGTSLRFSLSSLPVVEFLFGWPGAGQALLDMLRSFQREPATLLLLALGTLFILVNILLDLAYRRTDPRLAMIPATPRGATPADWLRMAAARLRAWPGRTGRGGGVVAAQRPLPVEPRGRTGAPSPRRPRGPLPPRDWLCRWRSAAFRAQARMHWARWRVALANPSLAVGGIMALLMAVLVLWGPALARTDVYRANPAIWESGVRLPPPLAPSARFPLGTDAQGRDILDLILVGARRTLIIAVLANQNSFGVPMLSMQGLKWRANTPLPFQIPLWKQEMRPRELHPQKPVQAPPVSRPWTREQKEEGPSDAKG
jgi:ABC-type dipeptide/oligopeptide/nickel transport system permease component